MRIIGIPSDGPELNDKISDHFGHCNYFVGVKIDDEMNIIKEFAFKNDGHSSCMEPVLNMRDKQVSDMIVGGIGGRPYMGFLQVGINLYQGIEGNLKENVMQLINKNLKPLGEPSCSGTN
ncbi:MAG: NifB/NifX family molybdenum-iron cluster-binding protein [Promethearchaeati archaeon]